MNNLMRYLCLIVPFCILASCRPAVRGVETHSQVLMVDSTLDAIQDTAYLAYIAPIKQQLEADLNAPIGYAPEPLLVHRPECGLLNWASDALLYMAQDRYPHKVDMAIVNIGGMRCEWAKGDITFRNVFELMPFDNELVVLTMRGEDVLALCQKIVDVGGEGIAGLRIQAKNGQLYSAKIAGTELKADALYTVATSDYLSQGNDGLVALRNHTDLWRSEEKIRDLYIQYIQRMKTVEAKVDGRIILK